MKTEEQIKLEEFCDNLQIILGGMQEQFAKVIAIKDKQLGDARQNKMLVQETAITKARENLEKINSKILGIINILGNIKILDFQESPLVPNVVKIDDGRPLTHEYGMDLERPKEQK